MNARTKFWNVCPAEHRHRPPLWGVFLGKWFWMQGSCGKRSRNSIVSESRRLQYSLVQILVARHLILQKAIGQGIFATGLLRESSKSPTPGWTSKIGFHCRPADLYFVLAGSIVSCQSLECTNSWTSNSCRCCRATFATFPFM